MARDGENPLGTQTLARDGKGLVNVKKRVPVPGETMASRAQAYVRREEHTDQMRRPKAAWQLEQRKFAIKLFGLLSSSKFGANQLSRLFRVFSTARRQRNTLKIKTRCGVCWSLVSMLRYWSCDSAARERGGGV